MLKILENPYIYQASVFLTQISLKKFKTQISKEAGFSPRSRVLDVCCGTGNFADLVKGEYFGFDLNEDYINYARRRFKNAPNKKFFVEDINKAEFEGKFFDNTLIISALHHFSEAEIGAMLSKIGRITSGKVIITDPATETKSPIAKLLISMDRGGYVRSKDCELELISRFLDVEKSFNFYSGFPCIRMIVCRAKKI